MVGVDVIEAEKEKWGDFYVRTVLKLSRSEKKKLKARELARLESKATLDYSAGYLGLLNLKNAKNDIIPSTFQFLSREFCPGMARIPYLVVAGTCVYQATADLYAAPRTRNAYQSE